MDNLWERINMSGVTQAVFMNQRSFGPPAIGAAYGGGFFAGQIGTGGVATHNLVVAPLSSGQTNAAWKNVNTATLVRIVILMGLKTQQTWLLMVIPPFIHAPTSVMTL
jgi:hypothetical protein